MSKSSEYALQAELERIELAEKNREKVYQVKY